MCGDKQCTHGKSLIFAAANSLIQSAGCIIFGVCALLMHACILTPTPPYLTQPNLFSAFSSSFYLQYFHSQQHCQKRHVHEWENQKNYTLGVVTSSDHVQWMFIGYTTDNALWLLATILLIVAKSRWAHITYVTIQFTVMLYDAILLILFGLDIKSYMNYYSTKGMVSQSAMLIDIIVMMLISTRFLVFYIVNVVIVVRLLRNIQLLEAKSKPPSAPSTTIPQNQLESSPKQPGRMGGTSPTESYPQQARMSTVVDLPEIGRRPSMIHSAVDPFDDRRLDSSQPGEVQAHVKPRRRYSPPEDYESSSGYEENDYDPRTSKKRSEPKRKHQQHRQAQPEIEVNSDVYEENEHVPTIVSALRRSSSNSEQLKNQRPWSYIRPEDLPSFPNKLNQFYSQLTTKKGSLATVEQEADESEPKQRRGKPAPPPPKAQAQQQPSTDTVGF